MSSMSRDISPPPSKRRRLSDAGREADEPTETAFTLYSWNINGIAQFVQPSIASFFKRGQATDTGKQEAKSPSIRDFLRRHAWPTLLFLQEVKINHDDATTISAVEKAVRRQHDDDSTAPSYRAHFCLPSDKHNARGFGRKVYGVCSIIREDFYEQYVETVRPVPWDREGRFLVIETRALGNLPKLAIINVYAVNGTDNPYKDPDTGEPKGTRHDRKLEVHALLQVECRKLEAEGCRCIVAGDVNIARAGIDGFPNLRTFPKQHCVNRADFEARFLLSDGAPRVKEGAAPCLGMVDTFRHLHPTKCGYTYYPRTKEFGESCDRVDMILTSKELEPCLREAGMLETPGDRGPSDHVPLYARLDFSKRDQQKRVTLSGKFGLGRD